VETVQNEATLLRYLDTMDTTDYATALELFADDAVYIRPALPKPASEPGVMGPSTPHQIEGRDALAAFFERRGNHNTSHDIQVLSSSSGHTFAEGVVTLDGKGTATILLHASFDDDGLIKRFIALR
jgi:ketosteroid isomerase-like protein